MKYTVFVDDNYRYMDESERYKLGEYEIFQQAELACRAIVDEFLQKGSKRESITAEELYNCYVMFGEAPWISGEPVPYRFSAWTYARERCTEICAKTLHEKNRRLFTSSGEIGSYGLRFNNHGIFKRNRQKIALHRAVLVEAR